MERRRVAMLGGTTTAADCAVTSTYLLRPWQMIDGPNIRQFETAFARRIGVRFACAFSSGRVALYGILRALDVGDGADVLLQVPTHVVVANAVHYLQARPVYVDCHADTYNMDLEDAERKITPRTRALVLQHTFGLPADLERAAELARRHGLELIEDCVHSLGATYAGRPVGSWGRASFFSTEETKTISTVMGGMAVTDDPAIAHELRRFQAQCRRPAADLVLRYLLKSVTWHALTAPAVYPVARRVYERSGGRQPAPSATSPEERCGQRAPRYETRLSSAQARLGLRQLDRLDQNLAHRARISAAYAHQLSSLDLGTPTILPLARPAMLRYPVRMADPDAAVRLAAPVTQLGRWFTSVLEEASSPECVGYTMGSCPRAEALVGHLVNLPTHGRVTLADVERITGVVATAARAAVGAGRP